MEIDEFKRKFNQVKKSKRRKDGQVHLNGDNFVLYADDYKINKYEGNYFIIKLYLYNNTICEIELSGIEEVY